MTQAQRQMKPTSLQLQVFRVSLVENGKSHIETRWGTTFINVAHLTRYHPPVLEHRVPRSWLLTFTDGSDIVTARCYLHSDEYAPQGWYAKVGRTIKLSKPFKMQWR